MKIMNKLSAVVVSLYLLFLIPSTANALTSHILPSGKEILIISMGKIFFSKDDPALILNYQTDIDINNVELLRQEVEEIWPIFRVDAEKSGLKSVFIAANTKPQKKFLILSQKKSFKFLIQKHENGEWYFSDIWKRNYENESKEIIAQYFEKSQESKFSEIVSLLHYPPKFSQEQLIKEEQGIQKLLKIITEEFGEIKSYRKSENTAEYLSVFMFTASPDYWSNYPYFMKRLYNVHYSKKGDGHLAYKFSIIKGKMVIHSIEYGLPVNGSDTKKTISNVFERVKKELM